MYEISSPSLLEKLHAGYDAYTWRGPTPDDEQKHGERGMWFVDEHALSPMLGISSIETARTVVPYSAVQDLTDVK